ncbi:MAG: (2Fe-2S)-binding protein [Caulobacterales bacterium]
MSDHDISVTVNGARLKKRVPARKTLLDFIRQDCGLTGAHAGCEHGVCGACTVIVDGVAVRSCLMFAVQTDGAEVRTVEGLSPAAGDLHPVQAAMHEHHGLQCGFCTPGIVMTLTSMTENNATAAEMNAAMSGHICRCTGYQGIQKAISSLAGDVNNG